MKNLKYNLVYSIMKQKLYCMKKIIAIQLIEKGGMGLSDVKLYYEEGNYYSFVEEKGTIENLCVKYKITKNEIGLYKFPIGKRCWLDIQDGITIFLGYC